IMASFGNVVKLLESYRGRDKIIRTTSFASVMVGGLTSNSQLSQRLMKISMELNGCRMILRLFDDLSMLAVSMGYGLGKKAIWRENDTIQRIFKLMSNFVNQMFFPIEHIAWAADKGLISISSAPWALASLCTWISSLLINIMRFGEFVVGNNQMKYIFSRSSKLDSKTFKSSLKTEALNFVENASNLGMAVHWLPGQQLWCGRLSPAVVGALGVTSSAIGLIKLT
uniref:Peroxisomal membrane protein 11C n=1 Tax=Ciona savignyi TaxID=51511 RepID=H2YGX6_CIOSA